MIIDPNNGNFGKYGAKIQEALSPIIAEMAEQGIPYSEIYIILESISCLVLYTQT